LPGCVEEIAQLRSVRVGLIGDLGRNGGVCVHETHHEVSTGESEEIIIDISLNLRIAPNLILLAVGDDFLNESVGIGLSIEVCGPQYFSAVRIVSSIEVLFGSIVDHGDSLRHEDVYDGVQVLGSFALVLIEEARVVVVIDESSKCIGIWILRKGLESRVQIVQGSSTLESGPDGIEHRVVEDSRDALLLIGDSALDGGPDFTDDIGADQVLELLPKRLIDVHHGVCAEAIEVVLLEQIGSIIKEVLSHSGVVLIEVR